MLHQSITTEGMKHSVLLTSFAPAGALGRVRRLAEQGVGRRGERLAAARPAAQEVIFAATTTTASEAAAATTSPIAVAVIVLLRDAADPERGP